VLCSLAILLVALELWNRRQLRYFDKSAGQRRLPRQQLAGWRNIAASAFALSILSLGFLVPAVALLVWSLEDPALWFQLDFAALLANSVGLATLSALIIVAAALVLVYGLRRKISTTLQLLIRGSGFGYAIPGTVIAIGVLWPFSQVDAQLDLWAEQFFGIRTGLILTGTIAALVFAYLVRFIAVAMQPLEAAFNQIPPSMDQAARSLGCNRWQLLWRVHRPLLAGPVWIALLLVFVDVLKELPATLLLRPFNFDTLAVRTFELASDEQLAAAAVPALTIVLAGLLPLIWLNRAAEGSSHAGH
jgi:iron(III) transport system permease protein